MYKTNITFKEQMTILYKGLQYNLMYKPKTWINIEASWNCNQLPTNSRTRIYEIPGHQEQTELI